MITEVHYLDLGDDVHIGYWEWWEISDGYHRAVQGVVHLVGKTQKPLCGQRVGEASELFIDDSLSLTCQRCGKILNRLKQRAITQATLETTS